MAIAFDNASGFDSGGSAGTSTQVTMTVGSGANRVIFVGFQNYPSDSSTFTCSYSGTSDSITPIDTLLSASGNGQGDWRSWLIVNPQSGSQTVTITTPSLTFRRLVIASYTGVNQSSTPDNHGTTFNTGTTQTITITVNTANSWLVAFSGNGNGLTQSSGTGTVRSATFGGNATGDSNAALSAGSQSITFTTASSSSWDAAMIVLAPATGGAAIVRPNYLPLLGVS